MQLALTVRQGVATIVASTLTGALFLLFCVYAIGGAWGRGEADLPAVTPWLQNLSLAAAAFPFAYVPGCDSILVAPVLNALLWSAVAGAICLWVFRRRDG